MIVKGIVYDEYIVLNKNELATCFAPRKYEIKDPIAELRRDKELPFKNAAYKPNYENIKNVYAVNAAKLLKLEAHEKKRNKISLANDEDTSICNNNDNTDIIAAVQPPPIIDIINNLYIGMLKQIILCDYKHTDFSLPGTASDLSSFVAVTKKRQKVRRLLTSREQQQRSFIKYLDQPNHVNLDPPVIDEIKIYNPDDDEEEREERRKLEEQKRIWEEEVLEPIMEKSMEEIYEIMRQLSYLRTQLPKEFIESKERSNDIKLGLKIADKIQGCMWPEVGITYRQLALDLFPEVRTKEQEGVEFEQYIQRIVRAIDAVQIYIFTRFFRKRTIRLFPLALPSKKDNVERVFNGYKKKYMDKVLCDFITTK